MVNENRVALISGGAGDLGFASAVKMVSMGYDIALLDCKSEMEASARIKNLESQGARAIYLKGDVADRESVESACDSLWKQFGRLDVAMCNAGISMNVPFLEYTVEQWNRHMDINLTGYFHVCQAIGQRWVANKQKGKMVFTGSWVQDVPYKLVAPYCVSKAGVWMLARCAALELAPHGITVNAVAPGIVDAGLTARELKDFPEFREEFMNLIPLGRIQTAEDVAEIVGFLISPAADYLTGACIMADGGCMVGCGSAAK